MQPNGRLDKPLASGSHTNWAYVVLTDDFNWFVGLEKSFFLIYYKRRRTGARKKERKKERCTVPAVRDKRELWSRCRPLCLEDKVLKN